MPLKKISLLLTCLFYTGYSFSQETTEKKNRLSENVTEVYNVLKTNEQIKNGPYEALYRRRTPVAMGNYLQGKKAGLWRFYNPKGALLQIYNYDNDSLRYEAKEYANQSDFYYLVDKEIAETDKITKPIKAGGRYYGYLNYLGLYQVPFSPYQYGTAGCVGLVELLISPLGRLAGYKARCVCDLIQFDQTINLDVNLFKEEDKRFIPATYNGEPVMSRILIKCRVTETGGLDFY